MPRPKMTDEQYLERYGFTREEAEEKKKEHRKAYNKKYQAKLRREKGTKKRKKKGTSVVIRRKSSKVIQTNRQLVTGLSPIRIRITTADLIILEQMQSDARELVRSTFEKHLNSKEHGHA